MLVGDGRQSLLLEPHVERGVVELLERLGSHGRLGFVCGSVVAPMLVSQHGLESSEIQAQVDELPFQDRRLGSSSARCFTLPTGVTKPE